MAWMAIIKLVIQGVMLLAGAIGVTRAFTGQPLIYAAGDSSGGGNQSQSQPDRVTSLPPSQARNAAATATASQWAANPWLWGAVGISAFGLTFLVRQTRGLGRDLGSATKSTRSALKEDLDELKGDPD